MSESPEWCEWASKKIKQLEEENAELKWFSERINHYVMPGVSDTQDSALKVFKEVKQHILWARAQDNLQNCYNCIDKALERMNVIR